MTLALTDRINGLARKIPTWAIYILYALPAPVFFYWAVTGQLGVEPIEVLEHEYGEIALQLLIIGLCITPLRRFLGVNLLKFRRAFGLLAFFYVVLHLLVWVVLDMSLLWGQMWEDIWKRPYITIGMVAFLAMVPLAVTSWNGAVRRMGASAWNRLHKLTYPVAILAAVHFIMVQKVWEAEPLIYLAIITGLIALRYIPKSKISRVPQRG